MVSRASGSGLPKGDIWAVTPGLGLWAGGSRPDFEGLGDGKDDKSCSGKQLRLQPGSIGAVRSCN